MAAGTFGRSSFRDGRKGTVSFGNIARDVKGTETGTMLGEVRIAVVTGTDDIAVVLSPA
jgi:hypothetical protein